MATSRQAHLASTALRLERVDSAVISYGLALILVRIGALKFASYEAAAIEGLVANSPVLSWTNRLASVPTVAALIGVAEIALGCLIAVRPFAPRVSALGSIGAILVFLTTLSLLLTTPGGVATGPQVPVPVGGRAVPGQGPDLLRAAVWTAGDSLDAASARRPAR